MPLSSINFLECINSLFFYQQIVFHGMNVLLLAIYQLKDMSVVSNF